jgi:hypothetical protein
MLVILLIICLLVGMLASGNEVGRAMNSIQGKNDWAFNEPDDEWGCLPHMLIAAGLAIVLLAMGAAGGG